MAVRLISHPFRIGPGGAVVGVYQGSDEHVAEQIGMLLSTHPEERVMVPNFGVQDPAFDELSLTELDQQVKEFDIPATITSVETKFVSDTHQDVIVHFE